MDERKARAFADFERMGVDHVRRQFNQKPAQGSAAQTWVTYQWAIEWLAEFDRQDRLRNEASQAESLETAKSAKNAAWEAAAAARDAAREAKTANTIATLALVAAVIAIAISIVAAFLK